MKSNVELRLEAKGLAGDPDVRALIDAYQLAKDARAVQKRYFKADFNDRKKILAEAQSAERALDKALDEIANPKQEGLGL